MCTVAGETWLRLGRVPGSGLLRFRPYFRSFSVGLEKRLKQFCFVFGFLAYKTRMVGGTYLLGLRWDQRN